VVLRKYFKEMAIPYLPKIEITNGPSLTLSKMKSMVIINQITISAKYQPSATPYSIAPFYV